MGCFTILKGHPVLPHSPELSAVPERLLCGSAISGGQCCVKLAACFPSC